MTIVVPTLFVETSYIEHGVAEIGSQPPFGPIDPFLLLCLYHHPRANSGALIRAVRIQWKLEVPGDFHW